jgi:hypothetical protein
MSTVSTIDDLLKKKVNPMDGEELSYLLTAARRRKEMPDYELISGRAATKDLPETFMALGDSFQRLARQLDASTDRLDRWADRRDSSRTEGPIMLKGADRPRCDDY